jgi:hypothetical protein
MPRPHQLEEEAKKRAWAIAHPKELTLPKPNTGPDKAKLFLRAVLFSAPLALFIGSIYEYWSLAGVVDSMIAARIVLIIGGLISLLGILISEIVWGKSRKTIIITGVLSTLFLGVGLWQLDSWTVRYRIAHTPEAAKPPIAALLEDNEGTIFDNFTVEGSLVVRGNKDSKLSNFNVNQDKPLAYTQWHENIARDAGSRKLIEKDFAELRSRLEGILNNPRLTDEQKARTRQNWHVIEQKFMVIADDRQKTLELLTHIGFEN